MTDTPCDTTPSRRGRGAPVGDVVLAVDIGGTKLAVALPSCIQGASRFTHSAKTTMPMPTAQPVSRASGRFWRASSP